MVISLLRKPGEALVLAFACGLAALHAVLAVTATAEKSMTSDEIAHLTAGHAYNTRGDFRLQPENGNLPQRLAALPHVLAGDPLPPTDRVDWKGSDVWRYGHAFFYGTGLPVAERLFQARAVMSLVSAATGLLVFAWSRALFGTAGGFISLVTLVFCPTFLAHGPLATSDMTMTLLFLAAAGAWWRHLREPGPTGALVSATICGLAFIAKFSAVLLVPMLGLLGILWWIEQSRGGHGRAAWRGLAVTALGHAAAVWIVIWAAYGFRFSAFAGDNAGAHFSHDWNSLLIALGWKADLLVWLRDWRVLPEAWLHGLAFVLQFARARGAFMSGEYSVTGWVSFFPWAFVIKTTLPVLVLLALTGFIAVRRAANAKVDWWRKWAWKTAPLAALFGVYVAASLASNLNIGHRHLLPIYPVLFIATGALAPAVRTAGRGAWAIVAALLVWHAAESWRVRPHYLAYFNQIVGGPQNGWRHLVDSSLDWGQDLPGLRKWLFVNARNERVFLSYFGTGDPVHEGIRATALPALPEAGTARRWHRMEPGVYAVSATMLQQVYSRHRGPWTAEFEAEFQRLRELEADFLAFQDEPARREELLTKAPREKWRAGWTTFESLRFARLCHYLRLKRPVAMIGYSILVFRLEGSEIAATTGGTIRDWQQALEAAAAGRPVNPPAAAPKPPAPPPSGG
ncbi:MAG: ArnT family glycosyltransferase [Opitutaceae bacterium]